MSDRGMSFVGRALRLSRVLARFGELSKADDRRDWRHLSIETGRC